MFLKNTYELIKMIQHMTTGGLFPYYSEDETHRLELKLDETGRIISLRTPVPSVETVITQSTQNSGTAVKTPQTYNPNYPQPQMYTISTPPIKRVACIVNIKVSKDYRDLISVEWAELTSSLTNNGLVVTNAGIMHNKKEGQQIMSALYLSNGYVIINGKLYSDDDSTAFTEDLVGEKEYSILEIMNLKKVYENHD
ncbi:hypothetical protein UES1_056 [Escherichia phage UE-S1]|nr:hypothetical protein UES1_056 [Escherichia phage UE-S1]